MSNFQERLKYAMRIRKMKQKDICNKTGLSKVRLSQYVNGIYIPKDNGKKLIAEALNVNEAWLMGYDVPMEDVPITKTQFNEWNNLAEINNLKDKVQLYRMITNYYGCEFGELFELITEPPFNKVELIELTNYAQYIITKRGDK